MRVSMSCRTAVTLAALLLVSCSRPPAGSAPGGAGAGAGAPGSGTPAAGSTATAARDTAPSFPTPAPAAAGTVSEVRTLAGMSPAQVMTTLTGRKSAGPASERDCGSSAELQCVDLVVAKLPKKISANPKVEVYARKAGGASFVGPCNELGDAIDCAQVLGAMPGASLRLVGRRPRLEFDTDSFVIRWRAANLAPEDLDVKLIVYY